MRGVALCEAIFARMRLRPTLRTMVGGLAVGLMAHGVAASHVIRPRRVANNRNARSVASSRGDLFCSRALASIASLGFRISRRAVLFLTPDRSARWPSGRRSLMITLADRIFRHQRRYAVIGMSALSASVIGGPLTMTFIALETTGDLWLTTAVLIAVIIAAR